MTPQANIITDWDRLLSESMYVGGETNFKHSFDKLTKKNGKAYKDYIKAAYSCKDYLTDEEFCILNHLPIKLLPKFIK